MTAVMSSLAVINVITLCAPTSVSSHVERIDSPYVSGWLFSLSTYTPSLASKLFCDAGGVHRRNLPNIKRYRVLRMEYDGLLSSREDALG
jgi:hypothetical protein